MKDRLKKVGKDLQSRLLVTKFKEAEELAAQNDNGERSWLDSKMQIGVGYVTDAITIGAVPHYLYVGMQSYAEDGRMFYPLFSAFCIGMVAGARWGMGKMADMMVEDERKYASTAADE